MTTFIKIAWRNIIRNRSRSLITISAVAIGLCALIYLKGFIDGADRQMLENYTDLSIGHIQIHKTGFHKNISIEKTFEAGPALFEVLEKTSGVKSFCLRIKDFTLISSPESSSGVLLLGIDPACEQKVSTLHKRIRFGEFLEKGDENKVIVGKDLAENLEVGLGDKVVIMTQASDGSIAAAAYEIKGILEAGAEEIDKNLALIPIKAAQDLLVLKNKISEIVIRADSIDEVDAIAKKIKRELNQGNLEVLSWKEISPMTYQWLQFDIVFTNLILIIVLIIVAFGILNTVLMGVLERIREFGIMLALGTRPAQIIFMVAAESFILGLCGVCSGGVAGVWIVLFFAKKGIDLSIFSTALNNFFIGSVIHTRLDAIGILLYSLTVLLVSVIVSLFPAIKASRLAPAEAIRHI